MADGQNQPGSFPQDPDPWRPPEAEVRPWILSTGPDGNGIPCCPECGREMQPGYLTTGSWLYWREWTDRSMLVKFSDRLPNTPPTFVGTNRLPGFRCKDCEVVVFRYGGHRKEWTDGDA
jgi:Domain of unknown function (DUF6487)